MGDKALKRSREAARKDVESESPAKRRRQGNDLKLSKLYEDLSAESDETRLEAAKQIIIKFSPENEPSADAIEKALARLISGLCSRRKAARFGFFVTLTELLRQLFCQEEDAVQGPKLQVNDVIKLVNEKTKIEGKVPGETRRDHLLGKLFGFKAIIQSRILMEPKPQQECWNKVLDSIYDMSRDIAWLREECGMILVEAIKGLNSQSRKYAQELVQRLVAVKLQYTPEGVAIWLTLKAHFADTLPTQVWNDQDPLSKKERTRLARILREDFRSTSDNDDNENIKSSAYNPNPIFAWDLVLSEVLRRDKSGSKEPHSSSKAEFPQFWIDLVDSNLFSASSSHERKSWGFKLFTTMIRGIPNAIIPSLFSPNLMRCLINQSKKDERYLHEAALAALKATQIRIDQDPTSASSIFVAMTANYGTIDLNKIIKTKPLEQILLAADDKSLGQIVRHLSSLILRPETQDGAIAASRRQTIADMLLNTVRNYKRYDSGTSTIVEGHDHWLREVLNIFVEHAYFVPNQSAKTSKVPLPPVNDSTRRIFQERLSSCLTRLLAVDSKSRASFALLIIRLLRTKATSSKLLDSVFKADKSVMKTVDKAFQTIEDIAAKRSLSGKKPAAEGFILLYSLALLQVYDGDGDAILLLDDLSSSHKSLLKSKQKDAAQDQDALVEILLTFLGNPRNLFRTIAQDAFAVFASDMSSDGLQALTDILDTAENADGQKELFEQGDDHEDQEDMDSDDDVVDVEETSDVEMLDGESEGTANDSDTVSTSEADSADEGNSTELHSDDDEDDEELIRFDNLLAHTLQTSKPTLAGGDSDDSSDDEDMNDEQMMALDPHLTKIFQERSKLTSKKKERKDAKQTVVQFKSRVLDLLTIYMDKEYSNPLTIEVILPILRRIRAGTNKPLMDKSFKILKTYTNAQVHHKARLPKPANLDQVWDILRKIHEEAKMGGSSNLHATACSNSSLHLVKILVGIDKVNYSKVVDVYSETQKQWFMNKNSPIQPVLFTQFQNWSTQAHKQGK